MTIVVTAVGSRGDVQPYAALAAALQAAGRAVCLAAPATFAGLAREAGVPFRVLSEFSPQDLTRLPEVQAAARRGGTMHVWLTIMRAARPLLGEIFAGCRRVLADAAGALISSIPFGALDSALARGIPSVYASLHLFKPTNAFPSPLFAPFGIRFNLPINRLTYQAMRLAFWGMMGGELNRWRQSCGLAKISRREYFTQLDSPQVPTIYGFSGAVLPPPADLPPWQHVTGYWFLDAPASYRLPDELEQFLAAGPHPIGIGFGSMDDQQAERRTQVVLEVLRQTGLRAVLLAGWGGFDRTALPPNVFLIDAVPHSCLFPRMAALVHHGGAGTTAAGLRAGVPAVITPFGGDQPFWAKRIEQLHAGVRGERLTRLTVKGLRAAIERATGDPQIRRGAADLGAVIRHENGVARAMKIITKVM